MLYVCVSSNSDALMLDVSICCGKLKNVLYSSICMIPLAIPALLILYYLECIIYVPSCYFVHPVVFAIVCALCGYLPRVAAASRIDKTDHAAACRYSGSCRYADAFSMRIVAAMRKTTKHAALVRIEFA